MKEIATFAGGCFWCTEAIFQRIVGVESVESGYCGDGEPDPSYETVSTGKSGYVEAVQIKFDPQQISFEKLLLVFFKTHDPTSMDQQGADHGPQYRSVVFFHSEKQKNATLQIIKDLESQKVFSSKIVTQVLEFKKFYIAEQYHQNFYSNNKNYGYCQFVINPKLAKFEKEFKEITKN